MKSHGDHGLIAINGCSLPQRREIKVHGSAKGRRGAATLSPPSPTDEFKAELTLRPRGRWRKRSSPADMIKGCPVQSAVPGGACYRDGNQSAIVPDAEGHQNLPSRRAAGLPCALDAPQHLAGVIGRGCVALCGGLRAGGGLTGGLSGGALLTAACGCLGRIALWSAR